MLENFFDRKLLPVIKSNQLGFLEYVTLNGGKYFDFSHAFFEVKRSV